jgi:hypothetical protein
MPPVSASCASPPCRSLHFPSYRFRLANCFLAWLSQSAFVATDLPSSAACPFIQTEPGGNSTDAGTGPQTALRFGSPTDTPPAKGALPAGMPPDLHLVIPGPPWASV